MGFVRNKPGSTLCNYKINPTEEGLFVREHLPYFFLRPRTMFVPWDAFFNPTVVRVPWYATLRENERIELKVNGAQITIVVTKDVWQLFNKQSLPSHSADLTFRPKR